MRTLLIDGDLFAYHAATAAERTVDFDGILSVTADAEEGRADLDRTLDHLKASLKADALAVALTPTGDPTNFRRGLYPPYKQNRKDVRRPLILEHLKQHLIDHYSASMRPTLEADDMLGIWATNPKLFRGDEKIIVSLDKDLRTIPGLLYNTRGTDIETITEDAADEWHLVQALAGDKSDGYPGCPGTGIARASLDLAGLTGWTPHEHTFKRGPRAGQTETRWEKVAMPNRWAVVLSHFARAGLTADDALVQAQVARICRHSDFDYSTKRPIPWVPSHKN